jgi:hypothetical protein
MLSVPGPGTSLRCHVSRPTVKVSPFFPLVFLLCDTYKASNRSSFVPSFSLSFQIVASLLFSVLRLSNLLSCVGFFFFPWLLPSIIPHLHPLHYKSGSDQQNCYFSGKYQS